MGTPFPFRRRVAHGYTSDIRVLARVLSPDRAYRNRGKAGRCDGRSPVRQDLTRRSSVSLTSLTRCEHTSSSRSDRQRSHRSKRSRGAAKAHTFERQTERPRSQPCSHTAQAIGSVATAARTTSGSFAGPHRVAAACGLRKSRSKHIGVTRGRPTMAAAERSR